MIRNSISRHTLERIISNPPQKLCRFLTASCSFVFILLLMQVTLSGCTKEASSESVEQISTKFYDSIQKKDYDKTLSYYAEEFFTLKPAELWVEHLKLVNNKLGDLIKVKLKRKHVSTIFSGRRFVFVFSNQYEKGLAKETVIFFQHTSKPGIKIETHKIESKLLAGNSTRH